VFVYWLGEYYVNLFVETLSEILGFQPDISFVIMDDGTKGLSEQDADALTPSTQEKTDEGQKTLSPQLEPALKGHVTSEKPENHGNLNFCRNNILAATSEQAGNQEVKTNTTNTVPSSAKVVYFQASRSINPKYTFDSFVVGSSNRFAHAAALAVAEQMAVNYNPLFIYGGVGLGKTHLLHAIGNHVSILHRTDRILYLSSEQFINELIFSIREDRMTGFRDKYRNIDLLLIDDIQFIARKERTQEEFFHTFNTLYHDRKQIVLTSDCPPKKIPTIAEQLRSRFEWGLIADIQPPDLETRVAILKKKADMQQAALSDEVAIYIASKVKSNIRELEGCLSKIRAYSTFNNQVITLELAQKVLQDLFETTPKRVTIELVQKAVANHYQVALDSMKSQGRSRNVTLPRQIAMYLSRELTNLSLPDIGRNFGGRDHTTVLHACKKVESIQAHDLTIKQSIMQIRDLIQA
jgi:chromosomal replication initiator protein